MAATYELHVEFPRTINCGAKIKQIMGGFIWHRVGIRGVFTTPHLTRRPSAGKVPNITGCYGNCKYWYFGIFTKNRLNQISHRPTRTEWSKWSSRNKFVMNSTSLVCAGRLALCGPMPRIQAYFA